MPTTIMHKVKSAISTFTCTKIIFGFGPLLGDRRISSLRSETCTWERGL